MLKTILFWLSLIGIVGFIYLYQLADNQGRQHAYDKIKRELAYARGWNPDQLSDDQSDQLDFDTDDLASKLGIHTPE